MTSWATKNKPEQYIKSTFNLFSDWWQKSQNQRFYCSWRDNFTGIEEVFGDWAEVVYGRRRLGLGQLFQNLNVNNRRYKKQVRTIWYKGSIQILHGFTYTCTLSWNERNSAWREARDSCMLSKDTWNQPASLSDYFFKACILFLMFGYLLWILKHTVKLTIFFYNRNNKYIFIIDDCQYIDCLGK